jgi:hypothetical protein
MFFPGMGMPKALPPKRKAEKEMRSKLTYFVIGAIVLQLAPYVSTVVAENIATLLGIRTFILKD